MPKNLTVIKMVDETTKANYLNAMSRSAAKRKNMLFQHDVGRKCLVFYLGLYNQAFVHYKKCPMKMFHLDQTWETS